MDSVVEARALKDALSRLASGVTVVTTECDGRPHGLTVTAFTPVSVDPPLVLVCLGEHTRSLPLIERSGCFAVHVLSRENAALGRVFASHGDPFAGLTYDTAVTGSPILAGCLAWLDCSVVSLVRAGDHSIAVGSVQRVHSVAEGEPVLYWSRAFRALSPEPLDP